MGPETETVIILLERLEMGLRTSRKTTEAQVEGSSGKMLEYVPHHN